MKSIILLAVVSIALTSTVKAQTSKGNLFLGTGIGSTVFTSTTADYSYIDGGARKNSSHIYGINAGPQVGVFVSNHLILGGTLGFNFTTNKTDGNTTETNQSTTTLTTNNYTVNLGPLMRYYIFNATPAKTLFYLQAQATIGTGYGNSTGSGNANTTTTYTSDNKINSIFSWTTGTSVGITHFIRKNIGLDFSIGYNHISNKSTYVNDTYTTNNLTKVVTTKTNNYDLTTGNNNIGISAGFHFFIDRKPKG